MLHRIRLAAQYASTRQLYIALALDAVALILLSSLAIYLLRAHRPLSALPLLLIALIEGITFGFGTFLIVQRYRQGRA